MNEQPEIKPLTLALVGCGRMGSAMLQGWLSHKMVERAYIIEPHGMPAAFESYSPNPVSFYPSIEAFRQEEHDIDLYVLAVKPQVMKDVCAALQPVIGKGSPVLSIAAGQTLSAFEKAFGRDQPIIRAMPNTPSAIGQGISICVANDTVTGDQKKQAQALLQAVGDVAWIEDEALMNAVTALSGSGPAYVFLLIEVLARAGVTLGLSDDLAVKLARQTVIGSAALAAAEPEINASILRQNVTSPGGTTAAALDVLTSEERMQKLFDEALTAAKKRGEELG